MRIIAISDVHENWGSLDLPSGDVLVIAGDLCERHDESFAAANEWLQSVTPNFRKAIYVPGNHDQAILEQVGKYNTLAPLLLESILVDSSLVVDGLQFHAMPWDFGDRDNPESMIPDSLDVLITHEPPEGILDWSPRARNDRLGNRTLAKRVAVVKPRLHIFGHCHMAHGVFRSAETTFVNVSICGDPKRYYGVAHSPTVIDLDWESLEVTQGH